MSHISRFLYKNGVAADAPSVAAFLEAHSGAYSTTRTQNNGSELLFWERHMRRLSNSIQLLLKANSTLLFGKPKCHIASFSDSVDRGMMWDSVVRCLINDSMKKVMPLVLDERKFGEELSITTLVSGNSAKLDRLKGCSEEDTISEALDVYLHICGYVPPIFGVRENAAHLAVVGHGRDFANAKYSDWVRSRKRFEKLRPPSVTELLLSNDGDKILEGCVTNFFVVCLKEKDRCSNFAWRSDLEMLSSVEIQTAALSDGVLPGVIRQVIKEICLNLKISFREVAPSWSQRESWVEAFVTNSLRILQHVETIQFPSSWDSIESRTWEQITWEDKQFENVPGRITSIIQREILEKAAVEAFPIVMFEE